LLFLKQIAFTLLLCSIDLLEMFPTPLRPTILSVCMPLCLHWILRSFELMTILSLTAFCIKDLDISACLFVFELHPTFKIIDLEMDRELQVWIGSSKFFYEFIKSYPREYRNDTRKLNRRNKGNDSGFKFCNPITKDF
jgi:hypothetical protein